MATSRSKQIETVTPTQWAERIKADDVNDDVLREAASAAREYLSNVTVESVKDADDQQAAEYTNAVAVVYSVGNRLRMVADAGDGSVMEAAAYATYDALTNRGVGRNDYAATIGKSTGYVTMLRRLGRVAFDLGVTPASDPDVWNMLANKGGANVSIVGKAIDPPATETPDGSKVVVPPTREGLDKALAVAFTPEGKKRSDSQIKAVLNPPTPDEGEGRDDDAGTEPVAPTRSLEANLRDAFTLIRTLVPQVTDDGIMSLEDAWNETERVVRERFGAALEAASAS